jgi:hypothetical protein
MAGSKHSTQEFVPIKEVRDGVLVEKNGSMRALLLCSSLNFALKSDDERAAIILQFQDFLNSLDFSVEILIQSRRLDIRPYLALLEEQEKKQLNNLMKIQTREYIEFIRSFTESTSIMTKSFIVVVPYDPAIVSTGKASPLSSLTNLVNKKNDSSPTPTSTFDENVTQLEERIGVVEQGLVRSGIRVARLGSDEIIELFYKAFNPGETEKPIKTS